MDDIIIKNGYIVDGSGNPWFKKDIWIKDKIIEKIGNLNSVRAKLVINARDLIVSPGFIDVHTHASLSTFLVKMVDLSGFKHNNNKEVWDFLRKKVKNSKPGEWIVCKGIDPILVNDLKIPTIGFLDSIAPNNSLLLLSQSLHSYWVNSNTFKKVKITNKTKDPSISSYYDKDENGELTGLVVEQLAIRPILELLKEELYTASYLSDAAKKVMHEYTKNGNTTIVSMGLTITDKKPLRLFEHISTNTPSFLNKLLEKLTFLPTREVSPRHFVYMRYDMAYLLPEKQDFDDDFYNIIGIKHWYDGSPYIGTMYLNEPYLSSDFAVNQLHIPKGHKGEALIKYTELVDFIRKYNSKGWQISIHTQGDAAINEVLSAFKEVSKNDNVTDLRHRLEHCLLLEHSKIDLLKELNITPSFHINHIYYYGDALKKSVIGEERANKILPVGEVQRKQIPFSLHADQPMFESKPFRLIQTAMERKTKTGDTLGFEQRISLLEGIKAMTIYPAWQIHKENKLGSLEKGKYADFVILDKNPFEIPTSELENIKIVKTFINGNEAK